MQQSVGPIIITGFSANLEIGKFIEKVLLFSVREKIREFETNASNQGKIAEFDWPKRQSGHSVIIFVIHSF